MCATGTSPPRPRLPSTGSRRDRGLGGARARRELPGEGQRPLHVLRARDRAARVGRRRPCSSASPSASACTSRTGCLATEPRELPRRHRHRRNVHRPRRARRRSREAREGAVDTRRAPPRGARSLRRRRGRARRRRPDRPRHDGRDERADPAAGGPRRLPGHRGLRGRAVHRPRQPPLALRPALAQAEAVRRAPPVLRRSRARRPRRPGGRPARRGAASMPRSTSSRGSRSTPSPSRCSSRTSARSTSFVSASGCASGFRA